MVDADLTGLNTLRLASLADRLTWIRSTGDLGDLVGNGLGAVTVLGGGSNVVLRAHLPGTVAVMRTRGIAISEQRAGRALLTAQAGERWHDVVRYALGQGFGGLENLALIPGSAGAAPVQNIGAYGVELADRLHSLKAFDLDSGRIFEMDAAACRFGYRHSRFQEPDGERLVVLEIQLWVERNPPLVLDYPDVASELARLGLARPSARDVAEAVVRIRRRKLPDPRYIGNAGSFFKNPLIDAAHATRLAEQHPGLVCIPVGEGLVKLAAAQLIDRCGWKGERRGAVGVWWRQPLVIVHFGGSSARELLDLAEQIRGSVLARYGVELDFEPRILGED